MDLKVQTDNKVKVLELESFLEASADKVGAAVSIVTEMKMF